MMEKIFSDSEEYFPDPRLDLLIEMSLDKDIAVPTGGWAVVSGLTEDEDDIPGMTSELDSSLLSQICLQQLGTWGCAFSEFCWSISSLFTSDQLSDLY